MELSEFNSDYLTNLLDTLSSEDKTVILRGDCNADLFNYYKNSIISDFLDFRTLPFSFHTFLVSSTSATLIDNVFTNNYNFSFASRNLANILLDHHAQFLKIGNQ